MGVLPLGPLVVGYSGGMDSSLLLHCAARSAVARARGLRALHVHHGLHPDADAWAVQAQARAQALGIACNLVRVQVDPRGQGIEAAAREARLAAFASALAAGGAMLLAHHQDDQAETLLLRLLRGASVDGLGAMRAVRAHGAGLILRPWLDQPRALLRQAAQELGIAWVEDPANVDPKFDRSWLRQQAWPLLAARFPALGERLARLAGHAASVSDEIETLAAGHLERLGGEVKLAIDCQGVLHALVRGIAKGVTLAQAGHLLGHVRDMGLRSDDPAVRTVARGLIGYIAFYQFFDALQTVAGHCLRAYRVTFVPMLVQTVCFWGVGLLGGAWLCYRWQPPLGVAGFWLAAVVSLVLAAIMLMALLGRAVADADSKA